MTKIYESYDKLGQVFSENIDDPILILDEKFHCEYSNSQLFPVDHKINEVIHQEDLKKINRLMKNILKLGYGTEEAQIRHNGSQSKWFEIKGKSFVESTDNKKKILLSCRDITKFKKLEFEIKDSQARFGELADYVPEIQFWKLLQTREGKNAAQKTREMLELVLDNIPQLIYWKDTNLTYMGCNKNFALLNNIQEPTSIIGRKDEDLIWLKTNLSYITEKEKEVMKNDKAEYNAIESLITINGQETWFEISRIPLHDAKGKVVGILVTYEDITLRKIAEQKLKESEEKYRGILENIKESYFEVDLFGNFTFFNDALCELQGTSREELMGANYEIFVDQFNKNKIFEMYNNVFETGKPRSNFQYQFRKKNGEEITCESSVYLRYDSDGHRIGFSGLARNITEKFFLEQKIKDSEEKYRTIFNSSPDYIFITDIRGNILDMNPALLERISMTLEEARGKNFTDFYAGDKIGNLRTVGELILSGNEIKGVEIKAKTTKGEIFEYEVNSVPLKEAGNITRILNLARDITLRKQTEQKLKESEKRYRHLFENSPYAIWLMDEEGTIVDCNSTMTNLLSVLDISDLIGKKFSDVLSVLKRSEYLVNMLKDRFKRFLKGEKLGPLEFQITRVDETKIWLSITSSLVKIGDKTLTQAIIRDITGKKNAEQKLKDSEVKYRHLFESTPYSIILINRNGKIIDCNPATEKLFNREIDTLINKNFLDVGIKPEKALPLFKQRYQSILEGVVPEPLEIEITKSKNGNLMWISIDDSLVEVGGENVFQVIIQDITEKKIAEQELKKSQEELKILNRELEQKVLERTKDLIESEQQYRTTINSLNDPLHVVDRDLRIILSNSAFDKWLEELGLEKDIVGRTVFGAFPFLPNEVREEYQEVFDSGRMVLTEGSLFLNNRDVFTETRKIPIFTENKVSQVITIIRDITESKKMENLLIESEQQYRTTIDAINDPLHVVDKELRLLLVNKELKNWLDNLDIRINVLGKRLNEAFTFLPDKIYDEYCEVFETGKPIITIETTILPNIDVISETRKIPIFSEGKVSQVITIIRDITESKKMENQLKESEKNFRNMITNLDEGYYKVAWEGNILYHNPAFSKIAGYDPFENLIGKEVPFFWPNPEDHEKYQEELIKNRFVRNYTVPIRKKNGEEIVVQVNAHLIKDEKNNPLEVEGTFSDITEKFRLEQELLESEKKLRHQNIELKKLDKVKNDFITMAAHELKTPLISISGYTDYILMKHRNQLNPEITTDLLTVQRNVNRLEVLMDQLLDVLKIDENELKLQKGQINVSKIINDCLDELSYLINEKFLEIMLNIEPDIIINADSTRIFTVFTNLISNAIKFTPDYGWIEINVKKETNQYVFEIKDNGIGLVGDEFTRLFKKFERIKPPIMNDHINIKDSGTGLGLYITKGIITAHGGEIWASSEGENKGSTFSFTLPL